MPTSARNNVLSTAARRQAGLTLVELLVTLSVLSLGTLIAASAMNAALPQRALNQAAELLVTDLKRARLEAQKSGEERIINIAPGGYDLNGETTRKLARGVSLETAANDGAIIFTRGFASLGATITLKKGERRAVVAVRPITGKVERVE